MWKNILLTVYTVMLAVFIILFSAGKLRWNKPLPSGVPDRVGMAELDRVIEMHKPQLFEMDGKQLICRPSSTVRGQSYQVNHDFYEYIDGKLVKVEYSNH